MAHLMDMALVLYVSGLLTWCVARGIAGDRSLLALALSYLGVWLFLPLLIFGPWALLSKRPIGLALGFPAGLFLWFYGPALLPRLGHRPETAHSLSIATFNLQVTNPDLEALSAVLSSLPADVITLQEVTDAHAEVVEGTLAERYPHRWHHKDSGLAIYSTWPIVTQRIYPTQPWPLQSAVIAVQGMQIHVINAHFARAGILQFFQTLNAGRMRELAAARAAQIAQIHDAIRETGLQALVACDGNMTDLTSAYAQMRTHLLDAFREGAWGLGHTFLVPRGFEMRTAFNLAVQRIDYLFHSPDLKVVQAGVISADSGSDHRPVWAQFELDGMEKR